MNRMGLLLFLVSLTAMAAPQAERVQSRYGRWLNEDVIYIISAEERAAFQRLTTDEEREKFIEQFWLRRDPTPGTSADKFKEEHYRRIATVNQRFACSKPGWKTDRGRIYIMYGPPDKIENKPAADAGEYPSELWLYNHIEGIGDQVEIFFVDKTGKGDYVIKLPPQQADVLRPPPWR